MQLCDVVYLHHLNLLQRRVELQELAAVLAAAQGAKVEPPPGPDEIRQRLDEMLAAEPVEQDSRDVELREALGLSR